MAPGAHAAPATSPSRPRLVLLARSPRLSAGFLVCGSMARPALRRCAFPPRSRRRKPAVLGIGSAKSPVHTGDFVRSARRSIPGLLAAPARRDLVGLVGVHHPGEQLFMQPGDGGCILGVVVQITLFAGVVAQVVELAFASAVAPPASSAWCAPSWRLDAVHP